MYRIFCESYVNFCNSFLEDSYRLEVAKPLYLITDPEVLKEEKEKNSNNYKKMCDLIYFMNEHVDKFPRFKAFLWTLAARGIEGIRYNVSSKEDLEEQMKLVNSFLKLAYWY